MDLRIKVTGIMAALDFVSRWSIEKFRASVFDPWGKQLQFQLQNSLYAYVTRRTGVTGESFTYRREGDHIVWNGNMVAYWLATGTAPHNIPKSGTGRTLLNINGDVRWGPIFHPGTKEYAYRQEAVHNALDTMARNGRERALAILRGG